MNTKRFGAAFVALLSMLATPTLASAQTAPATASSSAAPVASVRQLSGTVDEFVSLLTQGIGPFHQVGVHRVVRVQKGQPIVSHNAIFLADGIFSNFDSFMGATHSPQSLPVYLANNGIDVWGIDYGWALVPPSETDFTFMEDWGLHRNIDDLEKALAFARQLRNSTGSDGGRLTLLGHSLSVFTGFGLLSQETQMSCASRNVKAWIPSDEFFMLQPGTGVQGSCAEDLGFYNHLIAQGNYADKSGAADTLGGTLAQTDPNGTSPFFPQYTNLQAFLVVTAATWELQPKQPPFRVRPPFGHYYAGIFGPSGVNGVPTGLHYTSITRAENQYIGGADFMPLQLEADTLAICRSTQLPFNNHLQDIAVPVFYLGAAGGAGRAGAYTPTPPG